MGLMVGVELKGRVTPVLRGLMERSVMALPAGNTVLRFLPPLSITSEDIDQVTDALKEVLSSLEASPTVRTNKEGGRRRHSTAGELGSGELG